MAKKKTRDVVATLQAVEDRVHPPVGIVLGMPGENARLVEFLGGNPTCYQMDLYFAEKIQEELSDRALDGKVVCAPDLWDMTGQFRTLIYPVPKKGERSLKIDMIEQAFQALQLHGKLIVLSPYPNDQFFGDQLKKVFGKVHTPTSERGSVFWCQKQQERPRRRHEIVFQVRTDWGQSLRFVSRPGVFCYGRFDDGARALVETMEIDEGDRILDLGCGVGTNGIHAGLQSGDDGFVLFADSNVRAAALADLNARELGLHHYKAVASSSVETAGETDFDVVLANPPYFAQTVIAQLFIDRAFELLRPGGRLYLVTKQPDTVGPMIADLFGRAEVIFNRGYIVLCAQHPGDKVALPMQ